MAPSNVGYVQRAPSPVCVHLCALCMYVLGHSAHTRGISHTELEKGVGGDTSICSIDRRGGYTHVHTRCDVVYSNDMFSSKL